MDAAVATLRPDVQQRVWRARERPSNVSGDGRLTASLRADVDS